VFDKPLPDVLDRLGPAIQRFSDSCVGPAWTRGVGLQKDIGSLDFLTGAFELLHHFPQRGAFVIRQLHDILLVHRDLLAKEIVGKQFR
jgi:hypothetical protein